MPELILSTTGKALAAARSLLQHERVVGPGLEVLKKKLAFECKVSIRTIEYSVRVQRFGTESLKAMVEAEKISISTAAYISHLIPGLQDLIVAEAPDFSILELKKLLTSLVRKQNDS